MLMKFITAFVLLTCFAHVAVAQTSTTTIEVMSEGSAHLTTVTTIQMPQSLLSSGSLELRGEKLIDNASITCTWEFTTIYSQPRYLFGLPENAWISSSQNWGFENYLSSEVELQIFGLENAQQVADNIVNIIDSLAEYHILYRLWGSLMIDEASIHTEVLDGCVKASFRAAGGWALVYPLGDIPALLAGGSGIWVSSVDNTTWQGSFTMVAPNLNEMFVKLGHQGVKTSLVKVDSLSHSATYADNVYTQRLEATLLDFARREDGGWVIESLAQSFPLGENENFIIKLPPGVETVRYWGTQAAIEGASFVWKGPTTLDNIRIVYTLEAQEPTAMVPILIVEAVICVSIVILLTFRSRGKRFKLLVF